MGYALPYGVYYSVLRISIIGIVLGLVSFLALLRRKESKLWLLLGVTSFVTFLVYTVKVDSGHLSSSASINTLIIQLRVFPKTVKPFYEKISVGKLEEENKVFNRFVIYEKKFEINKKNPSRISSPGTLF